MLDHLLGSASKGDVDNAFADSNGHLDKAKLRKEIEAAQAQDPNAFVDKGRYF